MPTSGGQPGSVGVSRAIAPGSGRGGGGATVGSPASRGSRRGGGGGGRGAAAAARTTGAEAARSSWTRGGASRSGTAARARRLFERRSGTPQRRNAPPTSTTGSSTSGSSAADALVTLDRPGGGVGAVRDADRARPRRRATAARRRGASAQTRTLTVTRGATIKPSGRDLVHRAGRCASYASSARCTPRVRLPLPAARPRASSRPPSRAVELGGRTELANLILLAPAPHPAPRPEDPPRGTPRADLRRPSGARSPQPTTCAAGLMRQPLSAPAARPCT